MDHTIHLKPVTTSADVPKKLRGTPLGLLLEYHNCRRSLDKHTKAELLVCMCMDYRKQLRLPANFAYVLRTGGGDIRRSAFHISYAVGVGGIRHIAIIAHNGCGMSNLSSKREAFAAGLAKNAGWTRGRALRHFTACAPSCEIGNEARFALKESLRLGREYPKVMTVPMFYHIPDGKLYLI